MVKSSMKVKRENREGIGKYYSEIKSNRLDEKRWFKIWMSIGIRLGWLKRYNIIRDYKMIESYDALKRSYEEIGGDERWGLDWEGDLIEKN